MLKEILDAREKADRNFWDAHRVAWQKTCQLFSVSRETLSPKIS